MNKPNLTLVGGYDLAKVAAAENKEPVDHGGGGGDNGDMEPRVRALEDAMVMVRDRLTKIETRLDNMPTKADLSDAVHTQTKWVIGIGFALMMAGIALAKLIG